MACATQRQRPEDDPDRHAERADCDDRNLGREAAVGRRPTAQLAEQRVEGVSKQVAKRNRAQVGQDLAGCLHAPELDDTFPGDVVVVSFLFGVVPRKVEGNHRF